MKPLIKYRIVALFGVIISILMILFAIYFTPEYVASNLSADGILEPKTINKIIVVRTISSIVSILGLFISSLFLIKPQFRTIHTLSTMFIKSYTSTLYRVK